MVGWVELRVGSGEGMGRGKQRAHGFVTPFDHLVGV